FIDFFSNTNHLVRLSFNTVVTVHFAVNSKSKTDAGDIVLPDYRFAAYRFHCIHVCNTNGFADSRHPFSDFCALLETCA
ncbi:MAG TPA: hypothetical protein VHK69_01270, partial [Chitinophagaceae bacterium]|nr:hypothetical protein [Chitinophagaceae bacterium]